MAERKRIVVLSHWSALRYYRLSRMGLMPVPDPCALHSLADATANPSYHLADKDSRFLKLSTADYAALGIYVREDVSRALRDSGQSNPTEALGVAAESAYMIPLTDEMDVLVGGRTRRLTAEGVRAHQCLHGLPPDALRQISASLYVVSPELMFVQVARLLGKPHLVAALATELAGSYSLLPAGMVCCKKILARGEAPFDGRGHLRGDGYYETIPLTTIEELREFAAETTWLRGTQEAERGLRAAVNNSASPLETVVDVSLSLSRSWGGAGCGLPEVNESVPLNEEGQRITGKRKVIADALFTSKNGRRIDVEPGGSEWHSGKDAMVSDNNRRLALERQRIEVIVVPWQTFRDPHAWMHICKRVACHLGKNFHTPSDRLLQRWSQVHEDFCDTDLLKHPPQRR